MLEQLRSSPLFSVRRLVITFVIAFLITLVDMLVIHLLGVETLSDLATETFIHGLGLYGAFTIMALFGMDLRL